jgi:hypothetical protein
MALVLADLVMGVAGGLLGGVRRVVDEAPCLCRARRATSSAPAPDRPDDAGPGHDEPPATAVEPAEAPAAEPTEPPHPAAGAPAAAAAPTGLAEDSVLHQIALEGGGELPPGPWRWHWVWPTPGRPSGMALVAADGTLVLWSAGGFAPPGSPPDGRPTADLASALADLPQLARAAAGADTLRWELERARAVAEETRRLLSRAAGTVDDEIGRVHRPDEGDEPADQG